RGNGVIGRIGLNAEAVQAIEKILPIFKIASVEIRNGISSGRVRSISIIVTSSIVTAAAITGFGNGNIIQLHGRGHSAVSAFIFKSDMDDLPDIGREIQI